MEPHEKHQLSNKTKKLAKPDYLERSSEVPNTHAKRKYSQMRISSFLKSIKNSIKLCSTIINTFPLCLLLQNQI